MREIKTTTDGWDCSPELMNVANNLDNLQSIMYEIKMCTRTSSVEDIVYEIKDILEEVLDELNNIDTDVEYIEVEDEDYAKGGDVYTGKNVSMGSADSKFTFSGIEAYTGKDISMMAKGGNVESQMNQANDILRNIGSKLHKNKHPKSAAFKRSFDKMFSVLSRREESEINYAKGGISKDNMLLPIISINKWVMFTFNFPSDFIDSVWADEISMRNHLKSKFSDAYSKVGSYAAVSYFYANLDGDNQAKLASWVMNNYKG